MPDQARESLVDREYIATYLTAQAPWCETHGAGGNYLGMGCLYYALVYVIQARTAVCLGSGGGFVPRLMRQAQRDLDIADTARTVLVDGNLPERGWGSPAWLSEDSFFRREFHDIEIILKTTRDAAQQIFAPAGTSIDYLHIDADHSFEGGLEDFMVYRQFLHPGSLLSLHDTRWQGAGIRSVLDYLRTRLDCETLELPNLGAGTAVVRIREGTQSLAPARHLTTAAVNAERRPDAPEMPPLSIGWRYLESEAFASRNIIAAHFLRCCASVIEIGGGKSSILPYLNSKHDCVITVDPFAREDNLEIEDCRIVRLRARFQDVEWNIPEGASYGMVMLGLELQGMTDSDYRQLFRLIDGAKITVIEFPGSWGPSKQQFALIRANTRTRLRFQTKLELEGNDFGDLSNSWGPRTDREIYVLEPAPS
ncbi:MAG TPA: class I SAM-dependent methyltransferase [Silvibacterium sp.]|jgi:hypothetical protein|nr:class I SAM-dependent methyltransferase [Silvibacterium sp.]